MMLLKKITDSWNALLCKKGKHEEVHKIKERAELPFPTTGIIGAIAGDCFGAAYEFHPVKHGDFDIYKEPRFTDDTVMTLAVAKWLTIDPEHTHEIMDLGLVVSRVFLNLSSHISKQIVILLLSEMPSLLAVMQILWRVWLEE